MYNVEGGLVSFYLVRCMAAAYNEEQTKPMAP